MRKINATLITNKTKQSAIFKIKDNSFLITTSDEEVLKIPYNNIKSFNYNDDNEILIINCFGGNSVSVGIIKDEELLSQLNDIVEQNKKGNKGKNEVADKSKIEKETNENNKENDNSQNVDKSKNNIVVTLGVLLIFIASIAIPIAYRIKTSDNQSNTKETCDTSDCRLATQQALEDIPEMGYVFNTVKSNELKCSPSSITEDEIILVKCTTTNDEIIDYYKSSTIWYGYLESADGHSYFRWADKDYEVVLEEIRK